ncbi:MAG: carboxylesterase family protein [Jejuia sp.]
MKILLYVLCASAFTTTFGQVNFNKKLDTITPSSYIYKVIKNDTLQLDFYHPKNDSDKLPLLVYVHGGGFASGVRNADYIIDFAKKIAERGFAVASISYRLTMKDTGLGCNVKARKKVKAFNSASDDIAHAINFLIKKKNGFNIDESKIILCGTSSGAEAVLNSVYNYNNRILPRKFRYAGVISMAGALTKLNGITDDSAIPTLLFHGTSDNLVPYYVSAHHFCNKNESGFLMLYGSRAIADRLKGLGKSYYLYSMIGEAHDTSSAPMHQNLSDIFDFLHVDVLGSAKTRQTERSIEY